MVFFVMDNRIGPSYSSSSMMNSWTFTFGDSAESILRDSYAVFSLYHSLRDAVDEVVESSPNLATFRNYLDQLKNVASGFEAFFSFSLKNTEEEDCLDEDVGIVTNDDPEACSVEESNMQVIKDAKSHADVHRSVNEAVSISSLVHSFDSVSSNNAAFINKDLHCGTPSPFLEKRVSPSELNDEVDRIMSGLYEELYKKLGQGECMCLFILLYRGE